MEPTYSVEIVKFWAFAGLFIGWVLGWGWNVYITRRHIADIVKTYIDEIHNQYIYLLNRFGIYKKPNGEWQRHEDQNITSGREVKAYQRSDTETK
jgi:hypothetical protein